MFRIPFITSATLLHHKAQKSAVGQASKTGMYTMNQKHVNQTEENTEYQTDICTAPEYVCHK